MCSFDLLTLLISFSYFFISSSVSFEGLSFCCFFRRSSLASRSACNLALSAMLSLWASLSHPSISFKKSFSWFFCLCVYPPSVLALPEGSGLTTPDSSGVRFSLMASNFFKNGSFVSAGISMPRSFIALRTLLATV